MSRQKAQLLGLDDEQLSQLRQQLSPQIRLVSDSRQIRPGDWFFAYPGNEADGRDFIAQAVANGAVRIIYEDSPHFRIKEYGVPGHPVKQLAKVAGILASELLANTNSTLKVIGVTGTNGKTSITQWLAQALQWLGTSAAIVGTNGNGFWGQLHKTANTTPDAITLQNLIHQFSQQGAQYLTLEVSSHGLQEGRVSGVHFTTAVFTNLTHEHLDYHGTLEQYFSVKKSLFYWPQLQHAIINQDNAYGRRLIAGLRSDNPEISITSYGFTVEADIYIEKVDFSLEGMQVAMRTPWGQGVVGSSLLGTFNAENLAATVGVLCGLGYTLSQVTAALSQIQPALGRMQTLRYEGCPLVVVDYAHTPDALKNVLQALHPLRKKEGKIWCVFGCGGNRDRRKRPLMGKVVQENADYAVITSDNPRTEEAQAIIREILPVSNAVLLEADRERAIAYAIKHAAQQDIVLIAGKGHETYQEIAGVKYPFDDVEVARRYLEAN
ncbi:MAG: UDP-N-acetylmuramoyl-L-alanyl-D-glutamate--2,6-diaminopimelate ligase [Neisseriaceae bacterium]